MTSVTAPYRSPSPARMWRQWLSILTLGASTLALDFALAAPSAAWPATPQSTTFTWSDERPDKGRTTTMDRDSLGVTTRLGDAALPRPPAELVRAWLQDRAKDAVADHPVTLLSFEVEIFEAAAGNRSLYSAKPSMIVIVPDVLGTLAGNAIARLIGERSTNSLVSSRIEVSIAGRKIVGMSRETISGRLSPPELEQVIRASLDDLAQEARDLAPVGEAITKPE